MVLNIGDVMLKEHQAIYWTESLSQCLRESFEEEDSGVKFSPLFGRAMEEKQFLLVLKAVLFIQETLNL